MLLPPRPTKLGPYDVLAKIAGGGMATVYLARARDPNGDERVAAIKVIRHDLAPNEQFVHMFLDEAKILSRLSHPNISRTLEFGVTAEQHFIAMELLLGRTLLDVWEACRANKLSLRLDLAAWVAARVADALHYAHELTDDEGANLGVIHRDVNPGNIFLTYDGTVKLFDFGLAKARGRRAKSTTGIVKGKLPYLAPEQVRELPIDRRTDIFQLGATLWEMTTMRRLFKRDNDVETVKAVRAGLVPDARGTVKGYPPSLWRIVKRSLESNPDDRYATAAELAHDLDEFVRSQGKDGMMPALIGAVLDKLFEGERERQNGWLRKTSNTKNERPATMMPPAPVPASSDLRASVPPPPPSRSGKPGRPPPPPPRSRRS